MKKSLALAMAMALGVTASAYAANPFSDVPAGHWAYDSINKLAAAGVIDGYGDSTFGGDKLMTRYEMAQIVAKAMAKGANVDKLAAEFADELDNLGVRVANLEQKADNVKITGEVRYKYMSKQVDANRYNSNMSDNENDLRSRIWITGQINDDWSYTGMLENVQDFNGENANKGEEDTKFQRAYVEGKLGGVKVTAGRYNAFFADGNIYDARVDGIEASYGSRIKVKGFAGKATDATILEIHHVDKDDKNSPYYSKSIDTSDGKYYGGELTGDFGKFKAMAGYIHYKEKYKGYNDTNPVWKNGFKGHIRYIGASYDFDGNVGASAMYLRGHMVDEVNGENKRCHKDGFTAGLTYKGAKASEAGSWGLFANYYNQGGKSYLEHTTDANTFDGNGFKGYGVGANYTFAKNIVGTVAYYDTEDKSVDGNDDQRLWADLTFTF